MAVLKIKTFFASIKCSRSCL